MTKKKPRKGLAHTFGWLRRPELDQPSYDVWEAPDGTLFGYFRKGRVPVIVEGQIFDEHSKSPPSPGTT